MDTWIGLGDSIHTKIKGLYIYFCWELKTEWYVLFSLGCWGSCFACGNYLLSMILMFSPSLGTLINIVIMFLQFGNILWLFHSHYRLLSFMLNCSKLLFLLLFRQHIFYTDCAKVACPLCFLLASPMNWGGVYVILCVKWGCLESINTRPYI